MLTNEGLDLVKRVYRIEEEVGARVPDPTETESSPKEGYVVIYKWQIRNRLKFRICLLLKEIIKQYRISNSQTFPLGICRIMAFDACSRKAGVSRNVVLFRYYYHIKKAVGGYYFSSRPKMKDFGAKYSEAGVRWRRRFYMVKKEIIHPKCA